MSNWGHGVNNRFRSKLLRFVLVDGTGTPRYVADSFDQALGAYVEKRKGIILDDESREAYYQVMCRRGWSIRRAETWVWVVSAALPLPKPTSKRKAK